MNRYLARGLVCLGFLLPFNLQAYAPAHLEWFKEWVQSGEDYTPPIRPESLDLSSLDFYQVMTEIGEVPLEKKRSIRNLAGANLEGSSIVIPDEVDAVKSLWFFDQLQSLSGTNMRQTTIANIDLSGINLDEADCSHSNWYNVEYAEASAIGTQFISIEWAGGSLRDTGVEGASFQGATMNEVFIAGLEARTTILTESNWQSCSWVDADAEVQPPPEFPFDQRLTSGWTPPDRWQYVAAHHQASTLLKHVGFHRPSNLLQRRSEYHNQQEDCALWGPICLAKECQKEGVQVVNIGDAYPLPLPAAVQRWHVADIPLL